MKMNYNLMWELKVNTVWIVKERQNACNMKNSTSDMSSVSHTVERKNGPPVY